MIFFKIFNEVNECKYLKTDITRNLTNQLNEPELSTKCKIDEVGPGRVPLILPVII